VARRRCAAAEQRRPAAGRPVVARTSPEKGKLELRGFVWRAVCTYAQLRTRQTHPEVQGGGLGYGRGIASLGPDGDRVAHGGEILWLKNKGKRAREDCSPHCKTLAKGRATEV
jgi:hypothetical protein